MAEKGNFVGREFVDFQDQLVEFAFEAKSIGAGGPERGRLAFKRSSEMLERGRRGVFESSFLQHSKKLLLPQLPRRFQCGGDFDDPCFVGDPLKERGSLLSEGLGQLDEAAGTGFDFGSISRR